MGWKRNRLQAMLDHDLANVHLIGNDEKEIACNKAFLAAASPVFKRMFFCGFREQTQDRCKLHYHSMVLEMVVKHCYCNGGSDSQATTASVDLGQILDGSRSLEEEAELLVALHDASRYFELNQMHLDLESKIDKLIFQQGKYRYVWALLTGLLNHHGEGDGKLWTTLVEFVVENPRLCSLGYCTEQEQEDSSESSSSSSENSIPTYHPNPDMFLEVLKRSKDTALVIRCLQKWFRREKKLPGGGNAHTKKHLMEAAKQYVDLHELSIFALSRLESSLLFPMQQIEQAVEYHRTTTTTTRQIIDRHPLRVGDLVKFYCVFGCSSRRLNGKYKPLNDDRDTKIFYKNEVYQGCTCLFVLYCCQPENDNKWLLSMTREKYEDLRRTRTIAPSQCGVHFYQAPYHQEEASIEDTNAVVVVPYNGWECVEGTTGKSPIVAPVFEEDLQ